MNKIFQKYIQIKFVMNSRHKKKIQMKNKYWNLKICVSR